MQLHSRKLISRSIGTQSVCSLADCHCANGHFLTPLKIDLHNFLSPTPANSSRTFCVQYYKQCIEITLHVNFPPLGIITGPIRSGMAPLKLSRSVHFSHDYGSPLWSFKSSTPLYHDQPILDVIFTMLTRQKLLVASILNRALGCRDPSDLLKININKAIRFKIKGQTLLFDLVYPLRISQCEPNVNINQVQKIINSMATNKALGIDNIPIRVIKDCLPAILPSIRHIDY